MKGDVREVRQLLGLADPGRDVADSPELAKRAHADLRRILTAGQDHRPEPSRPWAPWRGRSRWVLAGAAGLAVAVTGGLAVFPGGGAGGNGGAAYAATPPLLAYHPAGTSGDARAQLRSLAATAAQAPDARGAGRFDHIVTQAWSLSSEIGGDRVRSAVVPWKAEMWIGDDDSAVIRAADPAGAPGDAPQTTRYRPGAYQRIWRTAPPTDAAAMRAWLEIGHPPENGPAETLAAVTDLARERSLSPRQTAAMLTVLSDVPGLRVEGNVTDRHGRAGIGFALDSDHSGLPTRHTLILDPRTGAVLDQEQTLTTTAGKLNVKIPSVIEYEMYLVANRTTSAQ